MPEYWPLKERCKIQKRTPQQIVDEAVEHIWRWLESWNGSRKRWMKAEDRHFIEVVLVELERLRNNN